MRAKQRVINTLRQQANIEMTNALERGVRDWPLPAPPLIDPDFPPILPTSKEKIIEQALGLFKLDEGMFLHHLNSTIELVIPYRMSLSEEVFEEHEKWLLRRKDLVIERVLFATCITWLADSLDNSMPNTDKWWMAITLFNGLTTSPRGQSIHQGFHILESMAIATKPGAWHSQAEPGPHQMEWDAQASLPKYDLIAQEEGIAAANWVLDISLRSKEPRRQLLVEWILLLLERKELVSPLNLGNRMLKLANDESDIVSSRLVACLPRLIEADSAMGMEVLEVLANRQDIPSRRALADVLTRLFRRIGKEAVPLFEKMIQSNDETVLAATSATVGDIKYISKTRWADEILNLTKHSNPIVRRNLVATLRDYVVAFPEDERGILAAAWLDGDEVVGVRLRELLIRMEEVDPDNFSSCITKINDANGNLEKLWEVMELRHPEKSSAWKLWMKGESPPPATTSLKPTSSEIPIAEDGDQYLEDAELPKLSDALDNLDNS